MDQLYKDYQKRARELEFHFHDHLDDHNHPQARVLREEFRRLTEDFEQQRNPRSIEARMQTIQRQLQQQEHHPSPVMSVGHVVDFHDRMEDFRRDIRKFPHY